MARFAHRQHRPVSYPVTQVEIQEQPWFLTDMRLSEAFRNVRSRLAMPRDNNFLMSSRGTGDDSQLQFIDRQSGVQPSRGPPNLERAILAVTGPTRHPRGNA